MKKKIIIGIIIAVVVLLAGFAGFIALGVKMVYDYHDENTFADISVVTTKQGCLLDADVNAKDSDQFNNLIDSDSIKVSFIKGDTFTVDKYVFLVQDVEFEYAEIKLLNGSLYDGSKELKEGDIITLHQGEYVDLQVPMTDDSFAITVKLDKLWWF